MEQYKTCRSCNQLLPVANFYVQRRRNGYQSKCKACGEAYRLENAERIRASRAAYYQANKDKWKTLGQAARQADPEKFRQRSKAWREANPERYREQMRSWRERNRGKFNELSRRRDARKKGNGVYQVTKKELAAMLERPCFYCGGSSGTIDHVIPIARGGVHAVGNLVPACKSCNSSKKDLTIMEWRKKKGAA